MSAKIHQLQIEPIGSEFLGATEEEVLEFEQKIGWKLPNEYRRLLRKYCPFHFTEYVLFKINTDFPEEGKLEREILIENFYGISPLIEQKTLSVTNVTNTVKPNIVCPPEAIFIGACCGYAFIALDANHQVFYVEPGQGKSCVVAKDLKSFFKLLYFDEE